MGVTSDDINQVITEVWAPSLELDLYPTDDLGADLDHTAVLEASGGWDGTVVVRATASFATAVAAKMFGLPRGEVSPDDAGDAVGELANVVSGNLKSLLGEDEVDLGLPQVADDWQPAGEVEATAVLEAGPGFGVVVHVVPAVPATA